MGQIQIKFKKGESIEEIKIKLFDNRLTKYLSTHYSKDNSGYKLEHKTDNAYGNWYSREYDNNVKASWEIILTQISKLKDLGVKFTQEIPDKFDFDQKTLNYLHRVFTYGGLFARDIITNEEREFPFTSDYKTPTILDKVTGKNFDPKTSLYEITEPINAAVHSLESFTLPTQGASALTTTNKVPRLFFQNNSADNHNSLNVQWLNLIDNYNNGTFKKGYEDYNYNFMEYTEQHMVCLSDTILGKSPIVSYRDNDNPTLPDCTGRFMTDGSFQIYPNRALHEVYESDGFKSWLDKHKMNIDEVPLEMAIGHVVEASIPLESFLQCDLDLISVKWTVK